MGPLKYNRECGLLDVSLSKVDGHSGNFERILCAQNGRPRRPGQSPTTDLPAWDGVEVEHGVKFAFTTGRILIVVILEGPGGAWQGRQGQRTHSRRRTTRPGIPGEREALVG